MCVCVIIIIIITVLYVSCKGDAADEVHPEHLSGSSAGQIRGTAAARHPM